ncbi:MAG TPA: hypothetical protein VIL48_14745 [Acidimicrobiales bacterium]
MTDDHERTAAEPWAGTCPVRWLVDDIGRFLAGETASPDAIDDAGRQALARASGEVNALLESAFAAHEVVATELRLASPARGFRRTVFALPPTPVALMVLCLRLCDVGDDVSLLQHTAGNGTFTRSATWPFGMATAEELTRPPERHTVPLPEGLEEGLEER